jgi:hypothetical protein
LVEGGALGTVNFSSHPDPAGVGVEVDVGVGVDAGVGVDVGVGVRVGWPDEVGVKVGVG